jgi:FkbM family methyltransferase
MKQAKGFSVPDSDTYFSQNMSERGFQIEHLDLALKYVKNNRTALDIGAHIGTWSVNMADYFGTVHAFEPDKYNFECLEKNCFGCSNIVTYNLASGEKLDKTYIKYDLKRVGNSGSHYLSKDKTEQSIDMVTVDYFDFDDVDFIKIDVEGYEYFSLLGAEKTIKRCKPVIMIEEKRFGSRFGLKDKAASELLLKWGAKLKDSIGKDHIFTFDK